MQVLIGKQKNLLTVAVVAALSVGGLRSRAMEKHPVARSAAAELPQLQLAVEVPAHWRPFLSDDLAEAFASRLSGVFRRNGYVGRLDFLDRGNPRPTVPLLTVHLIQWQMTHIDKAECNFAVALRQGNDSHDLGTFGNTRFAPARGISHRNPAETLAEAADHALHGLTMKLTEERLVAGFVS